MCPASEPERPVVLDRRDGVLGELVLRRAGDHHEVIANGAFLMDTRDGRSERALVREATAGMTSPRVLLGGLGVGFSLDEALRRGVAEVTVVEIEPGVVEWARTHLGRRNGGALDDPRVRLLVGDLQELLGGLDGPYDAVCLDVDNGPAWLVDDRNAGLYGDAGLAALAALLAPGGRLAVWSAAPDPGFDARLRERFASVRAHAVPVARGPDDVVYVAST
jgi:spermidine synthase